ncbi:MAG: MoxR family ATPase, partial [Planctomycetaceae bacterium]
LQAMQEREVTVGQETYALPDPFFVIATQNPIEQEGTYPLPEAQLDRFMFNVRVDYPSLEEEEQILSSTSSDEDAETRKVLSAKSIVYLQRQINQIEAGPLTINYAARLVRATRPADESAPEFVRELVDWGAGPRAGQFLLSGGKAMAAMAGRPSVTLDDIRKVAIPVLRHRISTNFQAQAEGMSSDDLVNRLIKEVPEPTVSKYD